MTGSWKVIEKLDGASYRIEHQLRPGRFEKKHASMLHPYPAQLIPFEPVDGPDNRFSQIHKPISKERFVDAGLKGFEPIQPFCTDSKVSVLQTVGEFYWPSLAELNDELFELGHINWIPN